MRSVKSRFQRHGLTGNAFFALADNAVVGLFGFFYVVAFARILPKSVFGLVILFDVIKNLSGIFDTAVGQATIKYFAPIGDDDSATILGSSLSLKLLYWLVISLLLLVSRGALGSVFGDEKLSKLLLYLPVLLFILVLRKYFASINTARQGMSKVFTQDLTFFFVYVGLIFGVHWQYGLERAEQVVIVLIIARSIDMFVGFLLAKDLLVLATPTRAWLKRIFNFAKYSFVNSLGVFGFSKSDTLLLGLYLSTVEIAVYSAAAVVFNFFMLVNSSANLIVFPLSAKIHTEDGNQHAKISLRDVYVHWTTLFTLLSLLFVIPLLLFATPITTLLYGDKFPLTPSLIRVFAIWGLALPISRVAASILNGMGMPQVNARYTWISGLASVLLNAVLISWLGVIGAALASLVVALILATLYLYTMHSELNVDLPAFVARIQQLLQPFRIKFTEAE